MNALIFDTETNGFKRKYKNGPTRADKLGRVIQLAWEVVEIETGDTITKSCHLIRPDGWIIPSVSYFMRQGQSEEQARKSAAFWVENGFSTYTNAREGLPMTEVLASFIAAINISDLLVAHNLVFDKEILSAEMIRYGMRAGKRLPSICTMNSTVSSNGKKLKLSHLYKSLFNVDFPGAHDAGRDVSACARCLIEMLKRGIIQLPKTVNDGTN